MTLAISPTNSISHMNSPMMISNIFQINEPTPVTLCTMPSPLYQIYFCIYLNPFFWKPKTIAQATATNASTILKNTSVDTGLK